MDGEERPTQDDGEELDQILDRDLTEHVIQEIRYFRGELRLARTDWQGIRQEMKAEHSELRGVVDEGHRTLHAKIDEGMNERKQEIADLDKKVEPIAAMDRRFRKVGGAVRKRVTWAVFLILAGVIDIVVSGPFRGILEGWIA